MTRTMGIPAVALLVGAVVGAILAAMVRDAQISSLSRDVAALQVKVASLSGNTASGGGVNVKMMLDPGTGQPTVPLEEVFSFDRNHAVCRVDTNPKAFKMQTFKMGEVVIEPHQFFMSMVANQISAYDIETMADGKRKATLKGKLDCTTVVGQATATIGSRTASEPASFRIEAIDGGVGGGKAGDSFAFTVFFEPDTAPINHAIFGPEFTFTGQLVTGEVTIIDPRR